MAVHQNFYQQRCSYVIQVMFTGMHALLFWLLSYKSAAVWITNIYFLTRYPFFCSSFVVSVFKTIGNISKKLKRNYWTKKTQSTIRRWCLRNQKVIFLCRLSKGWFKIKKRRGWERSQKAWCNLWTAPEIYNPKLSCRAHPTLVFFLLYFLYTV